MTMTDPTAARRGGSAPPTWPGSFLLGSARELGQDPFGTLVRSRNEVGDVVHFRVGPPGLRNDLYCVYHPEDVRRVLTGQEARYTKNTQTFVEMRDAMGDGLPVVQDEEQWRRQRKAMQPMFTPKRVAEGNYTEVVAEEAARLADRWAGAGDGAVVDILPDLNELTVAITGRILFGDDEASMGTDSIRDDFPVLSAYIQARGLAPVRTPQWWPTPANRRMHRARGRLHAICDQVIAEHRARTELTQDFVGRLMHAPDATLFDDENIRAQVLLFLGAANQTTLSALVLALHLLGRHHDIQERAHDEVASVLGGRPAGQADAAALPYLRGVIRETMRLYPPLPLLSRRCPDGDEIGGFRIPPGATVWPAPWVVHRHPEFWPDPERFDPDRFSPERSAGMHRFSWIPFGGGPRTCLGEHFAMLEMTMALAEVLTRFRFRSMEDEIRVGPGVGLAMPAHVRTRVTWRER